MIPAVFLSLMISGGEVGTLPPLEIINGWPSWERIVEAKRLAESNFASRQTQIAMDAAVVWALVWKAAGKDYTERGRREAIKSLIDMIGWRAVLTGELPDPIPLE